MDPDFRPRPRTQLPNRHSSPVALATDQTRIPTTSMLAPKPMRPNAMKARSKRIYTIAALKTRIFVSVACSVLMVAVVIAAVSFVYVYKNAPERVAATFIATLQNGDVTAALKLTTSAFQSNNSASDVARELKGKISGKVVNSSSNTTLGGAGNKQAILVYTIAENGTKHYVRIELQRSSDNGWQISNFVTSDQPQNTLQVT